MEATALAVFLNHPEICEELLKHSKSVDAVDKVIYNESDCVCC